MLKIARVLPALAFAVQASAFASAYVDEAQCFRRDGRLAHLHPPDLL